MITRKQIQEAATAALGTNAFVSECTDYTSGFGKDVELFGSRYRALST